MVFALAGFLLLAPVCRAAGTYRTADTGAFLDPDGELFIPLGGFYGGWVPAQTDPVIDDFQLIRNVPEEKWREWFALLQANGVNLIRIFSCLQFGEDPFSDEQSQLDLAGRVNPDVWDFWRRYMEIGAGYGMRYQFLLLSNPYTATYVKTEVSNTYALPIYIREGWPQNRFVNEDPAQLDPVTVREYFTDPEAVALQKAYLDELLPLFDTGLIAAFEVINEQGWTHNPLGYRWDSQDEETAYTEDTIRHVKSYYPEVPIGFSHNGAGMVGMDPLRWIDSIPSADFYSFHFFPDVCGENEYVDYSAVANLIAHYAGPERAIECGESGIMFPSVPEPERTFALRDSVWFTMANGGVGYLQWPMFQVAPGMLAEYASARMILERHPVPLWHRKKSRWALDISTASEVLAASEDVASKASSPPWTTMARWDAWFRGWAAAYDMARDTTGYDRVLDPYANPPPDEPPDRPLLVTGAYEGITYQAEEGVLIYLRNGVRIPIGASYYRRKSASPLVLELSPAERDRRAILYDLDDAPGNPARVFDEIVSPGQPIMALESTDHDYVVVLEPRTAAATFFAY